MPKGHLHLQGLEVVGDARLGLLSHPLACPLLEPTKLLVDVHDALFGSVLKYWWNKRS